MCEIDGRSFVLGELIDSELVAAWAEEGLIRYAPRGPRTRFEVDEVALLATDADGPLEGDFVVTPLWA